MRRTIHTLLCLLIFSHPVDASPSVQQLFDEGNELYRKGAYEEAYQRFDSITHLGYESADLYYNMGNVAYKLGNNPLAILNYERAKKLKPADRDTYFNLGMANLKNIDKIEALPE
ncbi:MAG: tetratricopeptide repeat protein, partial [Flavobacteriales bacterium]